MIRCERRVRIDQFCCFLCVFFFFFGSLWKKMHKAREMISMIVGWIIFYWSTLKRRRQTKSWKDFGKCVYTWGVVYCKGSKTLDFTDSLILNFIFGFDCVYRGCCNAHCFSLAAAVRLLVEVNQQKTKTTTSKKKMNKKRRQTGWLGVRNLL